MGTAFRHRWDAAHPTSASGQDGFRYIRRPFPPMPTNLSLLRGVAGLTGAVAVLSHLAFPETAHAQGCVAVRGGMCMLPGHGQNPLDDSVVAGAWSAAVGYRWLHSDRHFVGDVEQTHRQAQGTEVINDSHFWDLGVSYQFTPRFSATFTLPLVYSDRSSYYEHSGGSPATGAQRGHSQAAGIGDVRLTGFAWIWDPAAHPKGNLQVGLGLKAPSGNYDATDTFNTVRGPEVHAVDQSIQPGDGGWGFTLEFFGYREIFDRASVYAQGYYLFNPEAVNGVSTEIANPRGKTITALNRTLASPTASAAQKATAQARLDAATALGYNTAAALEDVMSISDQYLARTGFTYTLVKSWGLALSLGGRLEGVPVQDALGSGDGFRRPGYTVSIEPGISLMRGRFSAAVYAPVALYRNRQPSLADHRWNQINAQAGLPAVSGGDAAFADFVISASVGWTF